MIRSNSLPPGFLQFIENAAAIHIGGSFTIPQTELFRTAAMAAVTAQDGDNTGALELTRYAGTIQPHRAHFPEGALHLDIIATTNQITRECLSATTPELL